MTPDRQRHVPRRRHPPAGAKLLRAAGVHAREATLSFANLDEADEIFVVGNYGR